MSHSRTAGLLQDPYSVIKRPVLTEKTHRGLPAAQKTGQEQRSRYTFEVHVKASKAQIRKAVEIAFGVKVIAINTMIIKPRQRTFRSLKGTNQGTTRWKKRAIVRLAQGSKQIELI